MKTLIIAGALGLGLFFTTSVNAQTPPPAKHATAHKTMATATKPEATQGNKAKSYTKAEATKPARAKEGKATAKPATTKSGTANAKPASAKQNEAMAHKAKASTVKEPQSVSKGSNSHSAKKAELSKATTK